MYEYIYIYIYMSYLFRKHCFVKEETAKPVTELQVLYTGMLKLLSVMPQGRVTYQSDWGLWAYSRPGL